MPEQLSFDGSINAVRRCEPTLLSLEYTSVCVERFHRPKDKIPFLTNVRLIEDKACILLVLFGDPCITYDSINQEIHMVRNTCRLQFAIDRDNLTSRDRNPELHVSIFDGRLIFANFEAVSKKSGTQNERRISLAAMHNYPVARQNKGDL